jgi:hypothetical protein
MGILVARARARTLGRAKKMLLPSAVSLNRHGRSAAVSVLRSVRP